MAQQDQVIKLKTATPRKRKVTVMTEGAITENATLEPAIPAKKVKSSKPHLNNLPGNEFVSAISKYRKSSDVIITVEGEAFALPKQLLCDLSPFFDRAFNGPFQEGIEQKMKLEDTDITSFQHVIRWMYMGSTAVPTVPTVTTKEVLTQYVGFFLLADRLDLQGSLQPDFDAVKAALQLDKTQLLAEHVRAAVSLPKNHSLRKLFAQACVRDYFGGMSSKNAFRLQKEVDDLDGFAIDLLKAFQTAAKGKTTKSYGHFTVFTNPFDGKTMEF